MERNADIRRRVLQVLRDSLSVNLSEEEMAGAVRLEELFGMDSMAALEFLVGLEREFGVRFAPEQIEFDLLKDLPRLVRYIAERMPAPDP